MSRSFAITFDYLCPFARIANETVALALGDGADWEVEFRPFSLAQAHIDEAAAAVWERPLGSDGTRGVRALLWAIAVRNGFPEAFLPFHVGLFEARHSEAADVDDETVLRTIADASGVDADRVAQIVAEGGPAKTLGDEHAEAVRRWAVFGVPTFVAGDEAVFVRLMERHRRDDVERVLDMLEWSRLNEFKRTRILR